MITRQLFAAEFYVMRLDQGYSFHSYAYSIIPANLIGSLQDKVVILKLHPTINWTIVAVHERIRTKGT